MNRVCLMGRIGRELELKKTNIGVPVVSFPLAVDRNGKDAGTDWIEIVAWHGNKRRSYEVQAGSVYFADSRRAEYSDSTHPQNRSEATADGFMEVGEDDGELPF